MLSRTTAAAGRVARFGSVLPGRNVCRATPTRPLRPTPYSTLGVAKEKITDEFFSAEIPITEYKNVDSKDTKTASPASSVKGSKIVPRPWLPESLRIGQPSFKNPNIIQEDLISIERLAEIWPGLRYFLIPRDARSKSIDTLSGMLTTWFKSKQLRKIATNKTLSEAELLGLVNSAEFKNSVNWQKKDFLEDCAETLARTIVDIGGRERPQKGTRTSRAQWPRPKAYTPEALVETLRLAFDSGKSKYFIRPESFSPPLDILGV
ncbi:hypothetical protein FPQ18DRAFT_45429 [Pyronema domesticum]|nr:hypothetical protein FPQ18DRAFT_45429 [Pyronema domesticum]